MHSTLKRRGNGHFNVVSTWNTHGVFVGYAHKNIFFSKQVFSCVMRDHDAELESSCTDLEITCEKDVTNLGYILVFR